jgi:hypothetical protein
VRDTPDTRPEDIAGDQVELPDADKDYGEDEKLEEGRVHHFTNLQNLPNRPRRAKRMSNLSEISA